MHPFWEYVIEPLLDAAGAQTIVEVGTDAGATTALLMRWAERSDAVVHSIDPDPRIDIPAWEREHGARFRFHRGRSIDVLDRIGDVDVALIDGDHNWYTVHSELSLLAARARDDGRPLPLVLAHDAGWPYARRDMYYEPDSVPAEHRHEAARAGIHPGRSELASSGFNYWHWNAIREGGARNGVLTAIEDFVREHPDPCELTTIDGAGGLAVLAARSRIEASPGLARALEQLDSPSILRRQISSVDELRVRTEGRLRAVEEDRERLRSAHEELRQSVSALEAQLATVRLREVSWARAARRIQHSHTWRIGSAIVAALRLLTLRRPISSDGPAELAAEIEGVTQPPGHHSR